MKVGGPGVAQDEDNRLGKRDEDGLGVGSGHRCHCLRLISPSSGQPALLTLSFSSFLAAQVLGVPAAHIGADPLAALPSGDQVGLDVSGDPPAHSAVGTSSRKEVVLILLNPDCSVLCFCCSLKWIFGIMWTWVKNGICFIVPP